MNHVVINESLESHDESHILIINEWFCDDGVLNFVILTFCHVAINDYQITDYLSFQPVVKLHNMTYLYDYSPTTVWLTGQDRYSSWNTSRGRDTRGREGAAVTVFRDYYCGGSGCCCEKSHYYEKSVVAAAVVVVVDAAAVVGVSGCCPHRPAGGCSYCVLFGNVLRMGCTSWCCGDDDDGVLLCVSWCWWRHRYRCPGGGHWHYGRYGHWC